MFRLLALLQLTRAALAFTAIADAWTVLLLRRGGVLPSDIPIVIVQMVVIAVVSFGLYGFGMVLNDLLDARRDRVFAPRRPIPSGRIQPRTAIVVALVLLMAAAIGAAILTPLRIVKLEHLHVRDFVPYSLLFTFATAALIVFYDAAAKYLGGLGLVTLGAIRAMHCLIGNPKTPWLYLSMILLTHVIVVSTVAYGLENKRPRLNRGDILTVVLGVLIGNGLAVWYMLTSTAFDMGSLKVLIGPGIAAGVYAGWALGVMRSKRLTARRKGERLMLMGLFWLFVYDASMLVSNGQYLAGTAITLLLLCSVLSFFGIRYWSRSHGVKVGYRVEKSVN